MIVYRVGLKVPASMVKSKRLHRKFIRDGLLEMAKTHHHENIPKHFEPLASMRYKYAPRSRKYMRQKMRRYWHQIPLVKTGRSKRSIIGNPQFVVSGSGEKATVKLIMRFAFPGGSGRFRKLNSHQRVTVDQMRKEVATVLVYERKSLQDDLKKYYLAQVKTLSRRQLKVK